MAFQARALLLSFWKRGFMETADCLIRMDTDTQKNTWTVSSVLAWYS